MTWTVVWALAMVVLFAYAYGQKADTVAAQDGASPTGLLALPGDMQVILDWNDSGEQDLEGYNVYRSDDDGAASAWLAATIASQYIDADVEAGVTYQYQVTAAFTPSGESAKSAPFSATIDAGD